MLEKEPGRKEAEEGIFSKIKSLIHRKRIPTPNQEKGQVLTTQEFLDLPEGERRVYIGQFLAEDNFDGWKEFTKGLGLPADKEEKALEKIDIIEHWSDFEPIKNALLNQISYSLE